MSLYRWLGVGALAIAAVGAGIYLSVGPYGTPADAAPPADAKPANPLANDLAEAQQRLAIMEKEIKDYSFTLVKRERVGGKLLDHEAIFTKIRHQPFSVYMYFVTPEGKKGQQVVYVKGQNNDKLVAQPVGLLGKLGPYHLPIDGPRAMEGQRYPITEIGIVNLTRRLIEVGSKEETYSNCVVRHYDPVKVKAGEDVRVCRMTEVINPVKRPQDLFHKARIYIEKERNIPIRFESYDFPAAEGEAPQLLEEYTYADLKLNNGFTDDDFKIVK